MFEALDAYEENVKKMLCSLLTNVQEKKLSPNLAHADPVIRSGCLQSLNPGEFWTREEDTQLHVVCIDADMSLNDLRGYQSIPYEFYRNICFDVHRLIELNVEFTPTILQEDTMLKSGTLVALTMDGNSALRNFKFSSEALCIQDDCDNVFPLLTPVSSMLEPPPPPPSTPFETPKRKKKRKKR